MHPFLQSFAGGLLIGAAVWLMLAGIGRVTGISGIVASAMTQPRASSWRFAFLAGLILGGFAFTRLLAGTSGTTATPVASMSALIVTGLLVGAGTRLGSGCTSGHGVCGLGRRSLRSLVATLVFMASGMAAVAVVRALGGAV